MHGSYFIRLRGQVQGPFDQEKLRQLARRGQFTRLHEVSADGRQWTPAGQIPELFPQPAPAASAPVAAAAAPAGQPVVSRTVEAPAGPGVSLTERAQPIWYYEAQGQPAGPVDLSTLQRMLARGELSGRTRVWREGMADWRPARDVEELAGVPASPGPQAASSYGAVRADGMESLTTAGEVAPEVLEILADSRKWVLLMSIVGLAYTGTFFLSFLAVLFVSIFVRSLTIAVMSLVPLFVGVVLGISPLLLLRYASALKHLSHVRRTRTLYSAFKILNGYWTYTSVLITIVALIFIFGILIEIALMSDVIGAFITAAASEAS